MIKIGVIGCGYWGPNLIRNFSQLENVELAYVCDLDETKLSRVKKSYPGVKTTKNYSDILADEEIKGICLATPLETHYEIAKESLSRGKGVLIEKPFTKNSQEAEELIGLADKNKLVLAVDHIFVYTAAIRKIKNLIDAKELGNLYYFDSERINLGLIRQDANVIWDLAAHDIAIIDYLFSQKPISVSALGSNHVQNNREEMAHITLKHEGGFMSHIHVSWLSPVKLRKILIGGDKKMVLYDDVEPTEKIKIYDKGIDVNYAEVTAFNPLYRAGDIVIPNLDQTEALKRLAEHFIDCLATGKKPLTDGRAGLRVVKILEAAQKSLAADGRLINLD